MSRILDHPQNSIQVHSLLANALALATRLLNYIQISFDHILFSGHFQLMSSVTKWSVISQNAFACMQNTSVISYAVF